MAEPGWYIRNELKLRHLHLLVALDDLRSMGKVAAHTHVTQPAVSKALGEMEKGLGMKLFERASRGIVPTVYGECLVRHARAVLNELHQAGDELRGLESGALGRITVGVLSNVIPALLPQSIALLNKRSPGINVHLAEGSMDRLLPRLLLGELDLIVGRPVENHAVSDLGTKTLSEQAIVLVTGPQHPLARRRALKWPDLRDYTWVLPPAGMLLRAPLERTFKRHGMPMPANYVEALSVQFVVSYLQLSEAIATTTRDIAEHYRRQGQLSVLKFNFPRLVRPLGIAWNRRRPLSPSTRLLIDCLEEVSRSGAPA